MSKVRILNKDSLECIKNIPDNSVDCVITDPPYGIDYDNNWHSDGRDSIEGDGDLQAFITVLKELPRILKNNRFSYLFCRWDVYPELVKAMPEDIENSNLIVWDKVIHGMGDLKSYAPQHEFIMVLQKGKRELLDGRKTDVQRFVRPNGAPKSGPKHHPHEKPLPLLKRLIKDSTKEGENIFEPFAGSGSTAVASKLLNRNCLAIEIDEEHYKTAKKRLKNVEKQLNSRKLI